RLPQGRQGAVREDSAGGHRGVPCGDRGGARLGRGSQARDGEPGERSGQLRRNHQVGIAAIMAEVGQKVSYLQKQGDNTAQGYKYARAQDVFLKVNEEIHKRGVACIASSVSLEESVSGLGKSGNQHRVIVRIVQTYKHDETGETATFEGLGGGQDSGDKAVMKANTAALKYLLTNAFNISWGDDPEATDPETG